MKTFATTEPTVTLDKIREGPIDLGKGLSISAVMGEKKRISFILFSHPTKDGTCVRGLPIRGGRRKWGGNKAQLWDLDIDRKRALTLSPSVWCTEHDVHGNLRKGEWKNHNFSLSEISQEIAEFRIERAIKLAEQYGGDYWGAILALASKADYLV